VLKSQVMQLQPCLPFPFPGPVFDRLSRLPTVGLLADDDELVVTAMVRHGVTTRADWKALRWVLRSRAWPAGWLWDIRADGDLSAPGALV